MRFLPTYFVYLVPVQDFVSVREQYNYEMQSEKSRPGTTIVYHSKKKVMM